MFQLHVLKLQWSDLGYAYTFAEVWAILRVTRLDQSLLLIQEADIASYDWENQEIWLTDMAIRRLELAGGNVILNHAVGRAFVVTLGDQCIYGGVFYNPHGAAALQFPVIHALGVPINILRIRPALGDGWKPNEPRLAEICGVIADRRIADRLSQQCLLRTVSAAQRPADPWERIQR